MPQTPELIDVILAAVDQRAAGVHTSLPGEIVSYDRKSRSASVQILITARYYDERGDVQYEKHPIIPRVPVVLPGDYIFGMSLPLQNGSPCLICFSNKAIERWKYSGKLSGPIHARDHHPSDCFAIPGAFAPGASPGLLGNENEMTIGAWNAAGDAVCIALSETSVKLGDKDATDPVVRKSDLQVVVDKLNAVINDLNGHGHYTASTSSGGNFKSSKPTTSAIAPFDFPIVESAAADATGSNLVNAG